MSSLPDIRAATGKTQGSINMMKGLDANETPVEDATSPSSDHISIEDWSQTGRGSHIDFGDKETVPIVQGTYTHTHTHTHRKLV